MPHISIRSLDVQYDGHHALRDISVDIPDGQITAIIGPSGCGKTTLLKSCNRLLDLTEGVRVGGEVLIDGLNILSPSVDVTRLRRKLGLLSQRPYPLPMCIYDNVAYGPRVHGLRNRRDLDRIVQRCLVAAGLWEEVQGRLRAPRPSCPSASSSASASPAPSPSNPKSSSPTNPPPPSIPTPPN